MNTTKAKSFVPGLKGLITLAILAFFIVAATGCGGGHGCPAYGNKQPSAYQAETIK
jgi:hypothetical protein